MVSTASIDTETLTDDSDYPQDSNTTDMTASLSDAMYQTKELIFRDPASVSTPLASLLDRTMPFP
jgi:hypothetical protein